MSHGFPVCGKTCDIATNVQALVRRVGIAIAAALASLALAVPAAPAAGLADHVRVFAGTMPGHDTFGGGHNFPGAAVPFGMVQWSPDTTPADRNGRGGYDYRDSHVRGFSLTHLSGAGCSLYGDFPFLPTTEPLEASPAARGSSLDGEFQPGFSHAHESGRPGYYSVRLNPVDGAAIDVELTATTRTGMARFTFPRNPHSSVLIDAGGSAQPDDFAAVQVDATRHEIDGTASSGLFCGQRPRYRVYVAAVFDRPFDAYGTWQGNKLTSGSTAASESQHPPPTRRPAPTPAPTPASTPAATGSSWRASASPSSASKTPAPTLPPKTPASASARSPAGRRGTGTSGWGGSASTAGHRASSMPSTPRSTTPDWRRAPSATWAAPTSAWTACCTAPAAASSTPTSPPGTPTALRSSCSRSWRRGGRAR